MYYSRWGRDIVIYVHSVGVVWFTPNHLYSSTTFMGSWYVVPHPYPYNDPVIYAPHKLPHSILYCVILTTVFYTAPCHTYSADLVVRVVVLIAVVVRFRFCSIPSFVP